MVQEAAGGSLWILVTVIGVAVLAIAMIYGTISWTRRRRQRAPGTVERAPVSDRAACRTSPFGPG